VTCCSLRVLEVCPVPGRVDRRLAILNGSSFIGVGDAIAVALLSCALIVAVLGAILRRLVPPGHPASETLFSKRSIGPDFSPQPQFLKARYLLPSTTLPPLSGLPVAVGPLIVAIRLVTFLSLAIVLVVVVTLALVHFGSPANG
jgi:hypothetical protein